VAQPLSTRESASARKRTLCALTAKEIIDGVDRRDCVLTGLPATFLFADIAGFTALTEAHGDAEAATLVGDFCDAVKADLPVGAAHVKTIGDALA
jgi:class 3 adenylate cyclase